LKLLVITSRNLEKSSTKYRIAQYADFFASRGINIEFIKRKSINSSVLKNIKEFDLVFNQRCLIKSSVSKKIFAESRKTIFDFDDAIYTRPGRPYSYLTSLRVNKRFRLWLNNADITTTSSNYLADKARQYSSSVVVIPMAVNTDIWKPLKRKPNDSITLGWAGAPVNIPNIERLNPVLNALTNKFPSLKLAIFSGEKPRLTCRFEFTPFNPGGEAAFVQSLDIGLLPLTDEEFSRGKSPIKAIQYLACGIPVVGNVFGATAEILNRSNSIAVSSDDEWISALEELILDQSRRLSMSQAARQFVLKHHNIYTVQEQLYRLFLQKEKNGEFIKISS
jgi:glycosyltransferase involved in cell wall biosynthesis